jgi:hypothetical protein
MFGAYSCSASKIISCALIRLYSELLNVFDVFIPQLLRYPNPSDPLNGEAASLLMKDAETYNNKVRGTRATLPASWVEGCVFVHQV